MVQMMFKCNTAPVEIMTPPLVARKYRGSKNDVKVLVLFFKGLLNGLLDFMNISNYVTQVRNEKNR
jgi:hypothetical protein